MREQLRVVLAVARDPVLARIELAYFGFNMAEYATWMAILVYAYGLGGAGTAAIVALVQLIPAGIAAPFASYAGDRFARDRALAFGYVLQAISLGATAAALIAEAPLPVAILFATIASTTFVITRPLQAVILPSITHSPGDLTAANAVSGLAENVGIFVGPLLGGIVIGVAGPGGVFAVFAVISLMGAIFVARLPVRLDRTASHPTDGVHGILAGTLGGIAILRRERTILLIVLVLSAMTVVVGALDIFFVATAIDLLHAGAAWAGFLYSAFGLGGVVGSFATVVLIGRRRMTPALAGSSGLFGLPISAIGIVPTTLTAPTLFGLSGAGLSIATVAGRTLLQRVAPEKALASVFGALEGLTMFSLAIGSVGAGALVATFGIGWGLVVAGLLVPAVVALAWLQLGRLDRDARAPDPEALELLRRLPIFAPLSAPTIDRILAELTRLDVPAGNVLIAEGDPGDRFYVLAEGTIAVTKNGVHLSDRGAGDHFGEIALLRNVPRTATVTALTPVRLIAIERERFLEAVTGHPQSQFHAEAIASERMAGPRDA